MYDNWFDYNGPPVIPVQVDRKAESCASLIAKATAEGKWLYEPTTMTYFAPAALKRLQKEGRFKWSPCNFQLVSPTGHEVTKWNATGFKS